MWLVLFVYVYDIFYCTMKFSWFIIHGLWWYQILMIEWCFRNSVLLTRTSSIVARRWMTNLLCVEIIVIGDMIHCIWVIWLMMFQELVLLTRTSSIVASRFIVCEKMLWWIIFDWWLCMQKYYERWMMNDEWWMMKNNW